MVLATIGPGGVTEIVWLYERLFVPHMSLGILWSTLMPTETKTVIYLMTFILK